ncbi:unnamed protein product [Mytilus coruscus]|uniref:Integrase catalytic domain-containing protein n=1 Tax=Mytilus coruscus TaxID=42192 RepID=A0A6J8EU30_MYTCO|nr:unnamed protein product [Mytilus coruscus]
MARNFNSKLEINEVQLARNLKFNRNKVVGVRNSNLQNRNIETYQKDVGIRRLKDTSKTQRTCYNSYIRNNTDEQIPLENISENKTQSETDQVETFEINLAGIPNSRLIKIAHMKDTELGQTDTVKMRIDTGDNPPVKLKPYRTPLHKREIVIKAITDILEANIIRRSNSNYSSPVVLVDKKDKTTRFCIDFRNLNYNTLAIRYPLPVIDDILTLLGAAKFYSLIDLRIGFWQVQMADEDKSKTAFVYHRELFVFNVMPFGLKNSPAQVFDRLRQHNLKLKLKKCQFLQRETNYLGFKINIDGVKPDDAYPDLKKPYVLYTDASNDTIGACLTQPCEEEETHLSCLRKEKPIYFFSHKLSDTQSRWSTIKKEAFSIHYALQKLDHYLHGAEFIIRTDHNPLKYLLLSPQCNKKLQLWALDIELSEVINQINTGKASRSVDNKHIIINDILHYISHPDDDLKLRLYIPLQLRNEVIKSNHDNLSHLGIDKCHDSIRQKYFWPKLCKELNSYINSCVICQSQSTGKTKPLLQISDIPPFPFAKIGVDLSGPYPTSLSGYRNNLNFSVPLDIVSDNGGEFTSKIFEETLKELNISHITTSFYHPQGNAKVERFHRTLHDVMAKKLQSDASTWDVSLNQTIAAIRFQKNELTKFSPFFLLYNRDPVLPIDNLLKPRRKYVGEDPHKILLEQQHKSFVLVHRNLTKSKEKQKQNADKNRQEINLEIGNPVYYKNHLRKNKLDTKWKPYYRIIEKTSPVTFVLKNQLDWSVARKVHLEHLKKAKIDEWVIPTNIEGRQLRKTNYVVPPNDSDGSESELPDANPRERLMNRYRQERETSSDEDNIPLAELKQKIANKKRREKKAKRSSLTSGSSGMSDNNSSDGYK